jgi:hypothetical protein
LLLLPSFGQSGGQQNRTVSKLAEIDSNVRHWMSAAGRRAYRITHKDACSQVDGDCGEDSGDGELDGDAGFQSETSVAVDTTGQHVVIGFNDLRGTGLVPPSVSGFAYSDDGGNTMVDGGQLPNPRVGSSPLSAAIPQVSGDPDVKYVSGGNGCQFIYSSILIAFYGAAPSQGTVQTLSIHRSTDCGHTWTGPFEVAAASNPNGQQSSSGNAVDAADKEFIDVDPDTGRVMITWTNFASTGTEISRAYSDDIMTGNPPTWSDRAVLATPPQGGSGTMPRFGGRGSGLVYVAWMANTRTGLNIMLRASPDDGQFFAGAKIVNPRPFAPMDYVLGNDRTNNFPSIAVDSSAGSNQGNLYVVYTNNDNGDGGDIVLQRSVDSGGSFSEPVYLNSNPGADRAQWFPSVTVDPDTGRVSVIYYDQAIAPNGDLTELTWIYSDDGGVTWSKPSPLSPRPFHAGYGNDSSQPNLGDYIAATGRGGNLFAAFATTPNQASFTDGQAPTPDGGRFPYPAETLQVGATGQLAVSLGQVTFQDSGGDGFIDPGEVVHLKLPLLNYALNAALDPETFTGVTGVLSSPTPGVTVTQAAASYGSIAAGTQATAASDFVVQVSSGFIAGSNIELLLDASSSGKHRGLPFSLRTGTPVPTQVFAENFDSAVEGSLPDGWATLHQGPTPPPNVTPTPDGYIVPWTTNASFCGTSSNGLFHINANDGPRINGVLNPTRWERAISPMITIPESAEYVTLEFDVCYDTEDDPTFPVTDYDGMVLRIRDFTTGRTPRAVLAEAFADSIQTGNIAFLPKHFPRFSNSAYFEDVSNWGGFSNGFQHVSMRLPGMAGSTVQLSFEFTQDSNTICSDLRPGHACGVMVDNIVMNSVVTRATQASNMSNDAPD